MPTYEVLGPRGPLRVTLPTGTASITETLPPLTEADSPSVAFPNPTLAYGTTTKRPTRAQGPAC